MQGPVLQPFAYDEAHPYAAGQHRGIDIGADAAGESVSAPAAGTVSFAGYVPTSGSSLTIQTADGYSVTLMHLGSISVAKGASVGEGVAVGTIGPSGTPEFSQPYVHLGIRLTTDPNGYLDPLRFLPPASGTSSTDDGSTSSQPSTSSAPAPAEPAPVAAPTSPPVRVQQSRARVSARGPRTGRASSAAGRASIAGPASARRPSEQSASRPAPARQPTERPARAPHHPVHRPTGSVLRPAVEATPPAGVVRFDAVHEIRLTPEPVRPEAIGPRIALLQSLALDGAAALIALAAAFAATQRTRRRTAPEAAQVLQIGQRRLERQAA